MYLTHQPLDRLKSVVPIERVPTEFWDQWDQWRETAEAYQSPFFSSQYIRTIAPLRPSAKLLVVTRQGKIAGLLACETTRGDEIEPLGKCFNDAHGLVCDPTTPVPYSELMRGSPWKAFRFHALAGAGVDHDPYVLGHTKTFMASLDQHPGHYVAHLEQTSETIVKQRRKTKKLIKQLGPLRLEFDCRCPQVLQQTIQWKRSQYRRNYLYDILGVPWAQAMLNELWQHRDGCRGLLSALYAGDTLIASHFGLLDRGILHYWFPTYDHSRGDCSPGTAMFLEMAKQSPEHGIQKIDLGYGDHSFKHKIADTISEVPHGIITSSRIRFGVAAASCRLQNLVRSLPGKQSIKRTIRWARPSIDKHLFE